MNSITKNFFFLLLILCTVTLYGETRKSLGELEAAFARDGFTVSKVVTFEGQRGIEATHKTAHNYETKEKKKVYYVEGSAYQMGYLMGLMAQPSVERMGKDFVDRVPFHFIKLGVDPDKVPFLITILRGFLLEGSKKILPDMPEQYIEEINGLVDGCKAANPEAKVNFNDLLLLNVGFDALLSHGYALGKVFGKENINFDPRDLEMPVFCNALSVFGKATKDGKHYFGRDFMFPTADVFEYTACMTIYNPNDGRVPMVSVGAPGFVGSIATMTKEKIGMGVDMVPGYNSNPKRPGVNSLLLLRHISHEARSAEDAQKKIVDLPRGVSWLYFLADGKNDRAFVAESGMTTDDLDAANLPIEELRKLGLLPNADFLKRFENQEHQKGIMFRWNDYEYPQTFHETYNKPLFQHHEKPEDENTWGMKGFINKIHGEKNCPSAFYFAPQRENKEDVLILTNNYIVPTMRLCSMNYWTLIVSASKHDDIQWRYDELNRQVLDAYGNIDEQKALELIDYLDPSRNFPGYYKNNKKSTDGKTKVLRGTVSLCNLTDLVIHSHYGFYKDEWLTLNLMNYID